MRACLAACLCAALFDRTAAAHTTSHGPTVYLDINGRHFSGSVGGFRDYLETMRSTNPALYARLVPDVERLERRDSIALAVFITGWSLGFASAAYGVIAATRDCPAPAPLGDPNFAVDNAAWSACNDRHTRTFVTFGVIGAATLMAGTLLATFAIMPSRAELQEVIDKHNRDCPHLIHLEVGYAASLHLAGAGLTLSF